MNKGKKSLQYSRGTPQKENKMLKNNKNNIKVAHCLYGPAKKRPNLFEL